MSEIEKSKLTKFVSDIEFENDFGQEPLALGRLTQDQAVICLCTLVGGFVGSAIAGVPLALVVLTIRLNDIVSINKQNRHRASPKQVEEEQEPEAIDVPAREVEPPLLNDTQPSTVQPVPAQQTAPTDEVPPTLSPQTKQELLQLLRQQCPALLSLVKSHPIRCVGVQRAGKTTMAKKLALLRMVLLPEHRVIASTPHYEPTNSYPEAFQIVGISNGKRDYPAIRKEWNGLAQRVENGNVNSITTIWDEFGLMDKVMEEEQLNSGLTSCLRETAKFGEHPIFIVHGETQAFLPGSKGLVTVFLNGTVRVEAVAGLKQISSPNEAQSSFVSHEYVTIVVQPLDKTKRHRCPKRL